ncbi:MAG: GNAT family N-acetyltransferase [Clostridia bacterium]|nr:GNAT family N-acetyltransferase [Clostridia bacterium]
MNIRHSTIRDLERMREIYAYARDFMVRTGNPNQWGPTNWPPEDLLRQDIAEGSSFVCEEDGRVVGTFFYVFGRDIEPTYREIVNGSWRDDEPFGVVHRLAGDGSAKGIGEFCLNWAFDQSGHLRVDTHGDNKVLQNLLEKLGFERRGTIFVVEDDYPRIAYEK